MSITVGMSPEIHRPRWEIDKRVHALIGENVRVKANAFSPPHLSGGPASRIEASSLVLPDNSTVDNDDLFFEGKLLAFRREVAVVIVLLGRPVISGDSANGRVLYRGKTAVILPGPATVELHRDHFIDKIPSESRLYWAHLRTSGPQFNLPFED